MDFLAALASGAGQSLGSTAVSTLFNLVSGGGKSRPSWRDLQFMQDASERLAPRQIDLQGDFLEGLAPRQAAAYNTYQDTTFQADTNREIGRIQQMGTELGMSPWELRGTSASAALPSPQMQTPSQTAGASTQAFMSALVPLEVAKIQARTQLQTAALQSSTQRDVAQLQSDTNITTTGMSNDTQRAIATLSTDTQRDIAKLQTDSQQLIAGWNNTNAWKIAEMNAKNQMAMNTQTTDTSRFLGQLSADTQTAIAAQATANGALARATVVNYAAQTLVAAANAKKIDTDTSLAKSDFALDALRLMKDNLPTLSTGANTGRGENKGGPMLGGTMTSSQGWKELDRLIDQTLQSGLKGANDQQDLQQLWQAIKNVAETGTP